MGTEAPARATRFLYRATLPRPDDPSIVSAIASAVRKGHPLSTAARLAGIHERTAQDWLAIGTRDLDDAQDGQEPGSHARFALAVKEAEAEMVEAKLSIVERDMATPGKGWLPAMTLLERRRPQDFGRFQRIEVDTTTTTTVRIELSAEAAIALAALAPGLLPESVTSTPTPEPDAVDASYRKLPPP